MSTLVSTRAARGNAQHAGNKRSDSDERTALVGSALEVERFERVRLALDMGAAACLFHDHRDAILHPWSQ